MMVKTLNDIRKARRATSLHGNENPEEVALHLEQILREAVALRTVNDGVFAKGAMKELKQIRLAMAAKQIDAGIRTPEMLVKYSSVIDQLNRIDREVTDSIASEAGNDGYFKDKMSSIMPSLPSTDTIVSAIMTANPLLGYGINIIRDIGKSVRENKERRAEIDKKRLELQREREEELLREIGILSDKANDEDLDEEERDSAILELETATEILEEIREEIHDLNVRLSGGELEITPSDIEKEFYDEQSDKLAAMLNEMERLNETESERLEREKLADERASFSEHDRPDSVSHDIVQEKGEGNKRGLLDMLGLGALARSGLGVAILGPIMATLATLVPMVLKFGGFIATRLLPILTVVTSVFDFIEGMLNPKTIERITGKSSDMLSGGERVLAGFSNMIGNVSERLDSLAEWLGFDLFDKDNYDIGKLMYDFVTDFDPKMFLGFLWDLTKQAGTYLYDVGKAGLDYIDEQLEKGRDYILEKVSGMADSALGYLGEKVDDAKGYVIDKASGWYNSITGSISSFLSNIYHGAGNLLDSFSTGLLGGYTSAKDYLTGIVTDMIEDTVNNFTSVRDYLLNGYTEIKDKVTDAITTGTELALDKITSIKDGIIDGATNLKDSAVEIFTNLFDSMVETTKDIVEDIIEMIKTTVVGFVMGKFNGGVNAYNNVKEFGSGLWSSVSNFFSNDNESYNASPDYINNHYTDQRIFDYIDNINTEQHQQGKLLIEQDNNRLSSENAILTEYITMRENELGTANAAPIVMAPNNVSNSTINKNITMGGQASSENFEPTHRRMLDHYYRYAR